MVLTNLKPAVKRERSWKPIWLSSFGFLLAILSYVLIPHQAATLRPLEIEEREVVISVLNQLAADFPQFTEWTEQFTEQFSDYGVPAFVDPNRPEKELVRNEEDSLYFTPGFFRADAVAQRNSLAKILLSINPAVSAIPGSDLAVKGD